MLLAAAGLSYDEYVTIFLILAAAVAGLLFLAKWLVRKVGCNCHDCGSRMAYWDELTGDERGDISAYFRDYERRDVDTSCVFVCRRCGYVYDDFSGERQSLEGDTKSFCKVCHRGEAHYLGECPLPQVFQGYRDKNPFMIDRTECLRCERKPINIGDCIHCDTPVKVLGCRSCSTLYAWVPLMDTEFKYLVPLTEERLLEAGPKWLAL